MKNITRLLGFIAFIAIIGLAFFACPNGNDNPTGKTLSSIAINTPPTKTDYAIGDTLDITGIEVTATYSDGTTGTVSITEANVSGFDSSAAGSKILTVTYGGKTATFTVTVNPAGPTLSSIAITVPPTKTIYTIGEALDLTGLVVTATYSDGTTGAVGIIEANVSGFDSTTVGEKTVTVTYGSKTATFTVTVSIIEMVSISAGTFTMGSPSTESGWYDDETQHSVTLTKSFYMGKYQVTQDQYRAVMGTGTGVGTGSPSSFTTAVAGESGTPGKLPVETVSWYDALVFCNKLSVMEGLSPAYSISGSTNPTDWGTVPTSSNATWNAVTIVAGSNGYRLPTEAQWEYACRAGTTTAFNDGNNDYTNATAVGAVGWYDSNSGSKTHQVGLKTANAWGLYDMHGNVWEWCWDWYDSSYYSSSPTNDPSGASSGTYRVARGGSWFYNGRSLRSAIRSDNIAPNDRNNIIGFRLVRP